jgi:CRISPR/Cas system-associated exonuclease Cas4 (RecB family)
MEQMDAGIAQIQKWLAAGVQPGQIGWVLGESSQVWPLLMHWDLAETGLHLGMPLDLRWTSSYSWAMAYLELLQGLQFKGKVSSVDWSEWINNPLWSKLNLGSAQSQGDPRGSPTFLYAKDLKSLVYQGLPLVPSFAETCHDQATQCYLHLAQVALTLSESKENIVAPMEQHALRSIADLIHQIAARLLPSEHPWAVWRKMWSMHLGSAALNPEGNALGGIRVMSLSDTLALDFDYLVFSGLNEGILPRAGRYRGMLSFDLRRAFGLPEPWADEARQAYAFYRLLQHCTEALLLYAHSGADGKVTEKSRFLQQLDLEYRGTMQSTQRELPVRLPPASDHSIRIPKTDLVMDLIRNKLSTKAISPSSLSLYLQCPLKFWFAYVRDLKATEEIDEQLNAGQIGSLFHLTLEYLFETKEGKVLLPQDWNELSEQIPQALDKACNHQDFKSYSFDQGVNVLVKRMGLQFLQEYFRGETKRSQHERIRLLGQELKFDQAFLEVDGISIAWRGRLDRLESNAGRHRIVDFKSGNMTSNSKELELQSLNEALDGEHNKAFQLLCYAWLAHENPQPQRRNKTILDEPVALPLELGIVPLQQANSGSRLLKVGGQREIDLPTVQAFEDLLRGIFRDLLNPQQPILQTEEVDRCKYCDFNRICRRSAED